MHQSNTARFVDKRAPKRKPTVSKKTREKVGVGELRMISPLTNAQREVFEQFHGNHLVLSGCAGTGKTFLSCYLALREITEYGGFNKLVIVRSAVPTRDQGFLPGTLEEKSASYEMPYRDIIGNLFGRGDAYDILKSKGMIEFMTTSYVRGLTIENAIVLVDEMQNMTFHELDSIITRLGDNSKIICCGDYRQSDLAKDKEREGLLVFLKIMDQMKKVGTITFHPSDIVRSAFVKSYIIAKADQGIY